MYGFPYFRFPFQYPYYRYYNNLDSSKKNFSNNENKNKKSTEESISSVQTSRSNKRFLPFSLNINELNNLNNPIINLLGIDLYLDDIVILCLLFILYKENVKDEMLFIALILLLLS